MWYAGLASLVLVTAAITAATQRVNVTEQIDQLVRAEMVRQHVPGLALAVIKNDKGVVVKGYGFANLEHRVPVTPNTIFQSASLGKQFTAAGIMALVESGSITLDDPISEYLPETTARWGHITVRHLLTHTSGILDHEDVIDYRRDYTDRELVEFASNLPRRFLPGERFEYSNTGYMLLGIIITRVAGKFYGDYLHERIFAPLSMRTDRVISEEDIVLNRAAGYNLKKGRLRNQEWVSPSLNRTGDGSLHITILDFLSWERCVRSRDILSADSWSQIFSPATLNDGNTYPYGFGWNITKRNGQLVHHHDG
ncbi:MAG: serine hydrolase domain-containing protein, partial [bacterium]|nr:serine hydrolase domain-containing protein [bacterium]